MMMEAYVLYRRERRLFVADAQYHRATPFLHQARLFGSVEEAVEFVRGSREGARAWDKGRITVLEVSTIIPEVG